MVAATGRRRLCHCAQYVGHIEQLRRPGDFVTAEVAGAPILVTLDRDGRLRAFHNVRSSRSDAGSQGFECRGWLSSVEPHVVLKQVAAFSASVSSALISWTACALLSYTIG